MTITAPKAQSPGKLVAISNRTAIDPNARAGGLAVALWDALAESKGTWIGWSGQIKDFPGQRPRETESDGVNFALCDLSKPEYESFYLGYSNSVLWPILHSRLDLAVFDHDHFPTFDKINARFALIAADVADTEDFIWVHDYHFFLVGQHLRQGGWTGNIGFFLHVPIPEPDIFLALPENEIIIKALCAYSIVGLQTKRDVDNLKRFLKMQFGAVETGTETLDVFNRTVIIRHCPIGIDAKAFEETSRSKPAEKSAEKIQKILGDRQLIIGVDRMDYSKGLPQRFEAVGRLFVDYSETRGKTSYTQIAPPSRSVVDEYLYLRKELDELSGHINGDYGDLDWVPIRYLARPYPREEIAGLYRRADVCLVTPLKDGMNLVAKEFIAAQDSDNPGVLILSQFAGAAEQMTDALIVNPYDINCVAKTIKGALDMPLAERRSRHEKLFHGICDQDLIWWRNRFLKNIFE